MSYGPETIEGFQTLAPPGTVPLEKQEAGLAAGRERPTNPLVVPPPPRDLGSGPGPVAFTVNEDNDQSVF